MKRQRTFSNLLIHCGMKKTAAATLFLATLTTAALAGKGDIPEQKEAPGHIIVFNKEVKAQDAAKDLKSQHGLKIGRTYKRALKGVFVPKDLPPQALEALQRNPNVAYIEKNQIVELSAQTIPTSFNRSDAEQVVSVDGVDEMTDVDIAVIDTGIDPNHPDLRVNSAMSVAISHEWVGHHKHGGYEIVENFNQSAWTDTDGHGTHVAGTIGAIDNGFGSVGVAPGARITAIRVWNTGGTSTSANLIGALDYVATNADTFEVANISLQLGYSAAVNQAVQNTTDAGVVVVVCAGN